MVKFPLILPNGASAISVNGIGESIAKRLDAKLKEYRVHLQLILRKVAGLYRILKIMIRMH